MSLFLSLASTITCFFHTDQFICAVQFTEFLYIFPSESWAWSSRIRYYLNYNVRIHKRPVLQKNTGLFFTFSWAKKMQCLKYFIICSCLSCIENLLICADAGHIKSEEQQQILAEDVGVESSATTGANKQTSEDDTKIPYSVYQAFAHVLEPSFFFFVGKCLIMKSVLAVFSLFLPTALDVRV